MIQYTISVFELRTKENQLKYRIISTYIFRTYALISTKMFVMYLHIKTPTNGCAYTSETQRSNRVYE